MLQDVRYAVRVLLQSKGRTAMVVLSLALGIGANGSASGSLTILQCLARITPSDNS